MKKFYHRKLIRDKIPQIIEANNGKYEIRIIKEDEFKKTLREKLVEEAKEVKEVKKKSDLLKELADVLEVIKSIAEDENINFELVETKQKERRNERGGFEKKLFLIWSDRPSGE